MAVLNFTGAETGDFSECQSTSGTVSVDSSVKFTGSYSYRANPTTTGTGSFSVRGLAASGAGAGLNNASVYASFMFRVDTLPASGREDIVRIENTGSNPKASLAINSSGRLEIYSQALTLAATGVTTLVTGRWYLIELKLGTGNPGPYEIRVNHSLEFAGTMNVTTGNSDRLLFGKPTNRDGQTIDVYFDDIVIRDDLFPGLNRAYLLSPNGAGNYTAWTSDWTAVDEVPHNGDTDYITSTQVNNDAETPALVDSGTAGMSGSDVAVLAVKPFAVVSRDGASNGAIQLRARSGSTDSDTGSNFATTSTYTLIARLLSTDPSGGAAWTLAGLDGLQVGVVEKSTTQKSRCTSLGAMVAFKQVVGRRRGPVLRRLV